MSSRLAVIAPFHQRHESALPLLKRLYVDSTHTPYEAWFVCETTADKRALDDAVGVLVRHKMLDRWPPGLRISVLATPRNSDGKLTVLPYAYAINYALDFTTCDLITYLDNGSIPWITKYEVMVDAMTANPGWGACYVGQKRTGYLQEVFHADEVIENPYSRLNFTQPCHRLTDDRWPLDLELGDPDTADGVFFAAVAKRLGPFHPAGSEILDEHYMPSPAALSIR